MVSCDGRMARFSSQEGSVPGRAKSVETEGEGADEERLDRLGVARTA